MRHESKCRNLHGHRYVAEVTVAGAELDTLGRVIDFGVVKDLVGGWIDERWDHGTIANVGDGDLVEFCVANGWRVYAMEGNPTAENIARELHMVTADLLAPHDIEVVKIRIYETPNCYSEYP